MVSSSFLPGATSVSRPPLQEDIEAWVTRHAGKTRLRRAGGGGALCSPCTGKFTVASPAGGDKDSAYEQLRREQVCRAKEHYLQRLPSVRRHIDGKPRSPSAALGRTTAGRPASLSISTELRGGLSSAPATTTSSDVGMCTGQSWWRPLSVPAPNSAVRAEDELLALSTVPDEAVAEVEPQAMEEEEQEDGEYEYLAQGFDGQPAPLGAAFHDDLPLISPARHTWMCSETIDVRLLTPKPRHKSMGGSMMLPPTQPSISSSPPVACPPPSPFSTGWLQRSPTMPLQGSSHSTSQTRAASKEVDQLTRPRPPPLGSRAGRRSTTDPSNFLRSPLYPDRPRPSALGSSTRIMPSMPTPSNAENVRSQPPPLGSSPPSKTPPADPDTAPRPRPPPLGCSAGITPRRPPSSDPDNFLRHASIKSALEDRDTVLVRGDWVLGLAIGGGKLPRRQELPEGATVPPSRLTSQDKIVAISCRWLTKEHPDPDGVQLQTVGRVLWHFTKYWEGANVAIFIDWCSLYQEPRSMSEKAAFQRSLRNIHMWYAHQDISLWMITGTSDRPDATSYGDRGWPTFEQALAGLITPASMVLDLGKLDDTCEDFLSTVRTCAAKRPAPADPESFYQTLLTKRFSHASDRALVEEKYQEAFQAVLIEATRLYYSTLGWNDGEIVKLSVSLPRCSRLTALELSDNRITPDGFGSLCHCLPQLPALSRLALDKNLLRNRGAELLSHVLPRCFTLEWMDLRQNQIIKLGVDRLACCHMPTHLRFIDLRGNNVKRGHTSAERIMESWKRAGKPLEGLLLSMPGL
mmetsp:Transcript_14565/g.41740  ORF Transcript_14565/g.41740 Transcript_14565/m.41740 type:complete len:802 (-) Transcript_14565:92-2497(-)